MTYGDNKIKDIAESVLPSRMRNGARDNLRFIKQKNRRAINRQLARIDSIDTYYDDPRIENLTFYPNAEIRYAVSDRQGADNVSALMQWAARRVVKEGISDPHDRYNFVKKMMPGSLPGRHALTHVADVEGFCDGKSGRFRSGCEIHAEVRPYRVLNREARVTREKDDLVLRFARLLEKHGEHKALNDALKKAHRPGHRDVIKGTLHINPLTGKYEFDYENTYCPGCTRPRLLYGHADVERFVIDLFYPREKMFVAHRSGGPYGSLTMGTVRGHHEWKDAALKFLEDSNA